MLKNFVYFNSKLPYDATKTDYKVECLKVIEEQPRKMLYFLEGLPNAEVDWMALYAVARTSIEKKEDKFTYYVFNGDKKELDVVATVTIYLKDLKLINPEFPLLKETGKVGRDLHRRMIKKQLPTISDSMLDQISFFLMNSKLTFDKFVHEWNRQANDGDAYMVFRSKDNAYMGLSYKLVINKANFLNSL